MKKLLLILSICGLPTAATVVLPLSAFAAQASNLGDLSSFDTIAKDTLQLVKTGDMKAAEKRVTDFETAWDAAEPKLYAMDKQQWGVIDGAADGAISSLRKAKPNAKSVTAALTKLIEAIQNPVAK